MPPSRTSRRQHDRRHRSPQRQESRKTACGPNSNAGGYDEEALNREFAFVLVGSKAIVIRENADTPIEQRIRYLTLDAFRQWSLNRFTEIRDYDGKVKAVTWAKRWLGSLGRRQYDGVEFHPDANPDPNLAGGTPGYFVLAWVVDAAEARRLLRGVPRPSPHQRVRRRSRALPMSTRVFRSHLPAAARAAGRGADHARRPGQRKDEGR